MLTDPVVIAALAALFAALYFGPELGDVVHRQRSRRGLRIGSVHILDHGADELEMVPTALRQTNAQSSREMTGAGVEFDLRRGRTVVQVISHARTRTRVSVFASQNPGIEEATVSTALLHRVVATSRSALPRRVAYDLSRSPAFSTC